ncbi:dihydrodipicolinate synthase family protein [Pseudalkalibacillus salsuginis]|uniref:dihydrodipicolinate synthase family protein n=1 Tax=Pseudalkalibacillus salsuginis TaxID=2910972 RepID=UPI001F374B39|nr:dihydrodipicolinate synthase family protein [Pseudalkalibacillus salsuginis]MCF6411327.1 dihydrodipicolinate synthase family protein [Pseudalkalibacillus salsuginis]
MTLFHGLIPPVPTIVNEDYQIDTDGAKVVIDHLIDEGVNGLLFLGTLGEFTQLSLEERKKVAEIAVEHVNGRVPVIIGTGSTNTREAIQLSRHSESIGAEGIIVINPYYTPLSEEHLLYHYESIGNVVGLPLLLYNFPAFTGQDLNPDLIKKLVETIPTISGIKDTVESIGHIREVLLKVKNEHPEFSVFCGYDDHLLPTLAAGGDGGICASGNFAPHLALGLLEAFNNQDFRQVIEHHQRLVSIPQIYNLDTPFANVIKEAMKQSGIEISTHVFPPSRSLRESKKKILNDILQGADNLPTKASRPKV